VQKIVVEDGKAIAVRLVDGEEIPCEKLIATNAHPRHLALDLSGEKEVGTPGGVFFEAAEVGAALTE